MLILQGSFLKLQLNEQSPSELIERARYKNKETYVVSSNNAVQELQGANNDQKGHEDINQLGALGRALDVVVVNVGQDLVPVLGATAGALGGHGDGYGLGLRGHCARDRGGGGRSRG